MALGAGAVLACWGRTRPRWRWRRPSSGRPRPGHRVAHTAVHVHGGMGIDTSYPVHRYFIAAKHHEFALGGATAQLRRIGAAL